MTLSENLQYLRRVNNLTQEELAEKLEVSRQTVSKWEMNQSTPEIPKLLELSELFHCKVDELLKEDIGKKQGIYSEITIQKIPGFRMARYVMITPAPENDVNAYMDRWAENSGLNAIEGYEPKRIGWDFPYVSVEQQTCFGLRGYVAAYLLPEDFEPRCEGAEITSQPTAYYARITIRDPFSRSFECIPGAYKKIFEYLNLNGIKECRHDEVVPCFEYVYEREHVTYMDVFVHVDPTG
ncbi:MAG: helix-turn-helix domain-containing protein [Eubacteriales bacterium]|nr:helix-turn-helix domain-containing protein [Eubacteriales bacterium]